MTGFIYLHRKIMRHWISQRPDYFYAWVDMLLFASHRSHMKLINENLVELERGQFDASIRFLAARWGWSNNKVMRFFELLKTDTMIETRTDTGRTVVTICHYDTYQNSQTRTDTRSDTRTNTRSNTNTIMDNNGKEKSYNSLGSDASSGVIHPQKYSDKVNSYFDSIPKEQVEVWKEAYQSVDLEKELTKAKAWLLSNTHKRKTALGRFTNNWLSRANEKVGQYKTSNKPKQERVVYCSSCDSKFETTKTDNQLRKSRCPKCDEFTIVDAVYYYASKG